MPEHHFEVETFDDKAIRDARFQELRGKARRGLVKFSGVKEVEPELRRLARPGSRRTIIVQRAVFASTWSVAYPNH